VRGREHLPDRGPVLLVANHASYLDPPVISMATSRQVHFMAREEVMAVPVLGGLLRRCGVFQVRPGTADRAAIRRAMALLSEGRVVCIFPEGTRSDDGDLQSAQPGAALIASRSGAPLVPVAIHGTWDAYPRNSRWMKPARISVSFGPPVLLREEEGGRRSGELEGISRRIMEEIERLLDEGRSLMRAA
jgi:1-acyl-sn-glycerol-3-phosphate acyltransferase